MMLFKVFLLSSMILFTFPSHILAGVSYQHRLAEKSSLETPRLTDHTTTSLLLLLSSLFCPGDSFSYLCLWTFLGGTMGEEAPVLDIESSEENATRRNQGSMVDLYPLSSYYFGSRDAVRVKDEMIADRVVRLKSDYAAHGLRTCVEAVLLVELFKHPHVLLLQYRNSIFKLPGGRLRPGESDVDGLKRKLASKLSVNENVLVPGLEVGECIGKWWRPNFETLMYPFLPPNVKHPKECLKLFLGRLALHQQFVVPKNFKLLAVPLCQLHGNEKTYGPIISQIPKLLSKFSFNMMEI